MTGLDYRNQDFINQGFLCHLSLGKVEASAYSSEHVLYRIERIANSIISSAPKSSPTSVRETDHVFFNTPIAGES